MWSQVERKLGSSPLTRGKPATSTSSQTSTRLIPAHAGKTYQRSQRSQEPWAHPRSRGENQGFYQVVTAVDGSSPLTRGKRHAIHASRLRNRLIPAHAGKTLYGKLAASLTGAHPRSRGENQGSPRNRRAHGGSSPLTRGKRGAAINADCKEGLIPAHAGKTRTLWSARPSTGAHPRSRGENVCPARAAALHTGSSPLTRGKLLNGVNNDAGPGLIPAHAGKTMGISSSIRCMTAHPRSRGENEMDADRLFAAAGSSPLTRGKQIPIPRSNRHAGLIPAHAGKTSLCPI